MVTHDPFVPTDALRSCASISGECPSPSGGPLHCPLQFPPGPQAPTHNLRYPRFLCPVPPWKDPLLFCSNHNKTSLKQTKKTPADNQLQCLLGRKAYSCLLSKKKKRKNNHWISSTDRLRPFDVIKTMSESFQSLASGTPNACSVSAAIFTPLCTLS